MSTSAVDYYKVYYLKASISNANDHISNIQNDVDETEVQIESLRAQTRDLEATLSEYKENQERVKKSISNQQMELNLTEKFLIEIQSPVDFENQVFPQTGLPEREVIVLTTLEESYVSKIQNAINLIQNGETEKSLREEVEANEILNKLEFHMDARAKFSNDDCQVVEAAMLPPRSILTEDQL